MRVEIKLDPKCEESYAVLCAPRMSDELQAVIEILENEHPQGGLLTAKKDGRLFVMAPELVELVRTEGGELALYDTAKTRYLLSRSLQETQGKLGADFVRISKSTVVNIRRVDHVSPSFNGMMELVTKGGMEEYISRKYLREFKQRLGL